LPYFGVCALCMVILYIILQKHYKIVNKNVQLELAGIRFSKSRLSDTRNIFFGFDGAKKWLQCYSSRFCVEGSIFMESTL